MIVTTQSGSVYELDIDNSRTRRLTGTADPTPRQGPDGEWRDFAALFDAPTVGAPIVFVWGNNPDGTFKTTVTSRVASIGAAQA